MERIERYTASDIFIRQNEVIFSNFYSLKEKGAISRWDFVPCNLQRKLYSKKDVDKQVRPWVRCFSLIKNRDVFIPSNLVFFSSEWCKNDFSDTTGLATGNNLEEAILHALCEVIERHLEEVVCGNKIKVPTIDIGSIEDPSLQTLIRRLQIKENLHVQLSYMTGDFGVAAIRIFAYPRQSPYWNTYGIYSAIGVHPDKNVALARALTEFVQGMASSLYRIKQGYDKVNTCDSLPPELFNFFDDIIDHSKKILFESVGSSCRADLLDDIHDILGVLARKGCDVIVKDLTHPQLGIPTVRVIVKGLQPGILGISLPSPYHKVARISPWLNLYPRWLRKVKTADLVNGR